MKNLPILLTALLFCIVLNTNAQKVITPKTQYFIDSTKLNGSYFHLFDGNDIESINVGKRETYPDGAIFIKLKDSSLLKKILAEKQLSLNDIALKNNIRKHPVLFLLNGDLLTDTLGVRIPASYLGEVTVTPPSEMPYFKKLLPNSYLINVRTQKPGTMWIRGGPLGSK